MSSFGGMNAEELIKALDLKPHPEGGHFRETFRDRNSSARDHSTAIYYLLRKGENSHWHRVNAAEVWHFYAGDPLVLSIAESGGPPTDHILGLDIAAGQRPQIVVPANAWQAAKPNGEFTLVGCTVAPGFEFSRFEIAAPGWEPPH